MDVRSCRNCGRLFNYLQGNPICPACKNKLEDKFEQVKAYIREHGTAPMKKISDDNDVSIKQLKQWVREERLTFPDDSPVGIECENCGAMIHTGRYCNKCKNEMASDLQKMYSMPAVAEEPKKARDKDRMRFLERQ